MRVIYKILSLPLCFGSQHPLAPVGKIRVNTPMVLLISVVGAESLTALVTSVMSYLFHGRVLVSYLITGMVASFLAATIVGYLIIWILHQFYLKQEMLLENLGREKDRAEEAIRLKDRFLAMVTHDLQSPFTSILGLLQVLQADREHPLHPEHQALLEDVTARGRRALAMVRELLEMGRLQTGHMEAHPRWLPARALVERVVAEWRPLAQEKGLALALDVPAAAQVYADAAMLERVLDNLVQNAIKFTPSGGRVLLAAPHEGELLVQDTGVGIAPSRLPLLFQPESKISTLGTGGEKGTGLGLIHVQQLMQAQGAEIHVDSREGQGTTFYLVFPHSMASTLGEGDGFLRIPAF